MQHRSRRINQVGDNAMSKETYHIVINPENVITESNALVEASFSLTTLENKIISILASCIEPTDKEFKVYTLQIKDFMHALGVTGKSKYSDVRKITKNLMKNVFEMVIDGDTVQIAWLSYVRYNPSMGTVDLSFHPFLKPYFLQLKKEFTSVKLGNLLEFKGKYTFKLYKLLKQYQKIKTRTFTIDDLRHHLGTKDQYPRYANFKQRIISPAVLEINDSSDISIGYEEIKTGRYVDRLRFTIVSSKISDVIDIETIPAEDDVPEITDQNNQDSSGTNRKTEKSASNTAGDKAYKKSNEESHSSDEKIDAYEASVRKRLSKLGCTKQSIDKLFREHDMNVIEENLKYTELRKETVKYPNRYVLGAIRDNYANAPLSTDIGKTEEVGASARQSEQSGNNRSYNAGNKQGNYIRDESGYSSFLQRNKSEEVKYTIENLDEFEAFVIEAVELQMKLHKKYGKQAASESETNSIERDVIEELLMNHISLWEENQIPLPEPADFASNKIRSVYEGLFSGQLSLSV